MTCRNRTMGHRIAHALGIQMLSVCMQSYGDYTPEFKGGGGSMLTEMPKVGDVLIANAEAGAEMYSFTTGKEYVVTKIDEEGDAFVEDDEGYQRFIDDDRRHCFTVGRVMGGKYAGRISEYDYEKFRDALINRQDEIRLDIKRAERRLLELRKEDAETQLAIDNVQREHLRNNDKY